MPFSLDCEAAEPRDNGLDHTLMDLCKDTLVVYVRGAPRHRLSIGLSLILLGEKSLKWGELSKKDLPVLTHNIGKKRQGSTQRRTLCV